MSRGNPFAEQVDHLEPYAIYNGPMGFEWRVLKTYQHPDTEHDDRFAKWLVSAKSDSTSGEYSIDKMLAQDVINHGVLATATPEWLENYGWHKIGKGLP